MTPTPERVIEYPPGSGRRVELNYEEAAFLRGIYQQQKSGEISGAECTRQARTLLDLKVSVGAVMEPVELTPTRGERSDLGDLLRDQGIRRADDAADVEWKTRADEALSYVAGRRERFTTDAVWAVLDLWGVDRPREPRAMSGVLVRARAAGLCVPTGEFVPSVRPEHHSAPIRVWSVS